MAKYRVWAAYENKRSIDDLEYPDAEVEASAETDAARHFCDNFSHGELAALIIQTPDGRFFEIELAREWSIELYKPITQAEAFE